jgi:zinc transporter ZupT
MQDALVLLVAALVGGGVSVAFRWNDRFLHIALALSTGVFLGAVFLHLLPSIGTPVHAHAHSAHWEARVFEAVPSGEAAEAVAGVEESTLTRYMEGDGAWFFVLVGVLAVYLIEALLLRSHDHDELHQHRAVGHAVLLGLSVHSFTAGLGLGVMEERGLLVGALLIAMVAHKLFDAFSLASVLQLARIPRRVLCLYLFLFALITPAGMILGGMATSHLGKIGLSVVTSLAAGTFLFVSVGELLPEVFHHREDVLVKVGLLVAGVAITMAVHGAGA